MLPCTWSRDSLVTFSANNLSTALCVPRNFASLVSTCSTNPTSSSCHSWVTCKNYVSSSCSFYNWICNFLLSPSLIILYTKGRPIISSLSFTMFASAWHISSCTSSTTSICSIPIHDDVVVSNKCVVSWICFSILLLISLASTFSYLLGSLFSSSSI